MECIFRKLSLSEKFSKLFGMLPNLLFPTLLMNACNYAKKPQRFLISSQLWAGISSFRIKFDCFPASRPINFFVRNSRLLLKHSPKARHDNVIFEGLAQSTRRGNEMPCTFAILARSSRQRAHLRHHTHGGDFAITIDTIARSQKSKKSMVG